MKKIFIAFAAFAAMTAVSCVKDEQNPDALVPEPEPEVVYDYSKLVLNELCGAGEDNEKFWELYNTGSQEIDLAGVTINKDEELAWTGVKGQKISANGYFAIVGAKGTTVDGFKSGFSAKKSVIVELYAPDGTKLDTFQRGEKGDGWGVEDPDKYVNNNKGSWSRVPDGSGSFVITPNKTPGVANDGTDATADSSLVGNGNAPEPPKVAKVVLNELNGVSKFIELYNAGNAPASLEGWNMYKDGKADPNWTGAAGITIGAGEYLVLYSEDVTADHPDVPETLIFASGLSSKKTLKIELKNAAGESVDVFTRGASGEWNVTIPNGEVSDSFARVPNGAGPFKLAEATPGSANGESKGDISQE